MLERINDEIDERNLIPLETNGTTPRYEMPLEDGRRVTIVDLLSEINPNGRSEPPSENHIIKASE